MASRKVKIAAVGVAASSALVGGLSIAKPGVIPKVVDAGSKVFGAQSVHCPSITDSFRLADGRRVTLSPRLPRGLVSLAPPEPIRLATHNLAGGNPAYNHVSDETALKDPLLQQIVDGAPKAAIWGGQEVRPSLVAKLEALSRSTGNFTLVPLNLGKEADVLLVPKRYRIVDSYACYFVGSQARGTIDAVEASVDHVHPVPSNDWTQFVAPRGYNVARLVDPSTGERLTVVNTHLSYQGELRAATVGQLTAERIAAEAHGDSFFVLGDLNASTMGHSADSERAWADERVRAVLSPSKTLSPLRNARHGAAIDWIAGPADFQVVSSTRMDVVNGENALVTSDHAALVVEVLPP